MMGIAVMFIFVLAGIKIFNQPTTSPIPDKLLNSYSSGNATNSENASSKIISGTTGQGDVANYLYGIVTSKSLNLRASPSTDAQVKGSLQFGQIIRLTRRSGGWYQTDQGSWVSALYMEVRLTYLEAQAFSNELK